MASEIPLLVACLVFCRHLTAQYLNTVIKPSVTLQRNKTNGFANRSNNLKLIIYYQGTPNLSLFCCSLSKPVALLKIPLLRSLLSPSLTARNNYVISHYRAAQQPVLFCRASLGSVAPSQELVLRTILTPSLIVRNNYVIPRYRAAQQPVLLSEEVPYTRCFCRVRRLACIRVGLRARIRHH